MSVTTIWIECPVLQVRLELAPSSAASDLEILVLRALGLGVDDAEALARYFGLPTRIMVDLVADLWRSGHVTVNFGDAGERIGLTSQGRDVLQDVAAGREVVTSMRSPRVERFVLNRLTGTVLPFQVSLKYPRDRRLLVPALPDDPKPNEVSREALADALAKTVRHRGDAADRIGEQRIVTAQLVPRIVSGEPAVRYVSADVHVSREGDGSLRIAFADINLPIAVQRTVANRLTTFAEDQPHSLFVRTLGAAADSQFTEPPSLITRLTALTRHVDALPREPASQRQSRADQLRTQYHFLGEYVADRARHEVSVQVVHTARDHERAIRDLIRGAERQVVIALPWIDYDALSRYASALDEAVSRGVGLTVLWGIARDGNELDQRLLGVFDDLSRRAANAGKGGFVHVDRTQSSHIHAKVLLCDDRSLLITSKNFFSSSDLIELGVVIDAPPGWASPPLVDVAKWAYQTTPNLAHANHLIRDPEVYGGTRDTASHRVIPAPPQMSPALLDPEGDPALVQLWAREWAEAVEHLTGLATNTNPVCYLVADGAHRVLMTTAFREAQRRVIITSDKLSGRVVDSDFVTQVQTCLKRGVDVSLLYGTLAAQDEQAIARLETVTPETGWGRFQVTHRPGNHTKVLVFDDEVVVGSYNYLSFDGVYGAGRRRERAELSVHVHDRTLSDAIARLLQTNRYRGGTRSGTSFETTTAVPAERSTAARLAELVLEAGAMRPEQVAAMVPNLASREAIWRELRDAGVSEAATARLDAALYAHGTEQVRAVALRDAMMTAWRNADFEIATILRELLDAPDVRPRPEFTRVIADLDRDELAARTAVESLVLDETYHPAEAITLAVLEITIAMRTGTTQHLAANYALADDPLDAFEPWRDRTLEYIHMYGPVPVEQLRCQEHVDAAAAYDVLSGRIDRLARWHANHLESTQTVRFLLDGPYRSLRAAAVAHDAKTITAWLRDNAGDPDGGWLDEQVRLAGITTEIKWSRRRRLLLWTRDIFDAARAASTTVGNDSLRALLTEEQKSMLSEIGALGRTLVQQLNDDIETAPAWTRLTALFDEGGLGR